MNDFPFGFDRPEDSPGFLLWQTTITWQRRIKKALDPFGISHAQFVMLATLMWFSYTDTPPTQTTLARLSKLDKMTVSGALKKLTENGLITRAEHGRDPRANAVQLTTKGKKLARKLVTLVEQVDAEFFGTLEKSHEKNLVKILGELMVKVEGD